MATSRTFDDMLNEYLSDEIMREELVKRDYFLQKVKRKDDWKGGDIIIPFKGAGASSVKYNALTAQTDIAESTYVRGSISTMPEVWGTMSFYSRDLHEHDGKIPEDSFLKLLPGELDDFTQYLKENISCQLLAGPHFATVTDASDAATGIMVVDKIDRFTLGQKVLLDDDNSNYGTYYVIGIDVNTKQVTLSAARGSTYADVSAFSVAQNAVFYHDGVLTAAAGGAANATTFTSMKSALLSYANGGSQSIHGTTKTSYPILQAYNEDGSDVTATNILDRIFDFYVNCRIRGKGRATEIIMSLKHMGSILKIMEINKGGYKVTKDPQATLYGWMEIEIAALANGMNLKLVGVQEMDDDVIFAVDWSNIVFHTNGFIRKEKSPDGLNYFTIRATTGYQYVIDLCCFGDVAYEKPGHNGVLHSIPSY